jgi:pseudouridine synthase
VASLRAAERLIRDGRISVNGHVVRRMGHLVDPAHDAIRVDGRALRPAPVDHHYWMLHKPRGYVTTLSDPEGRPTVRDLLPADPRRRLFPVGRLDYHSEGLLLLTDDGALARALTHPSCEVEKTYAVKVRGRPAPTALDRLRRGLTLDGRTAVTRRLRVVREAQNAWLEVTVTEGRKHLVRRLLRAVGHPVVKLRRTAFAGLQLGDLGPGQARRLSSTEVRRLLRRAARTAERS